MANSFDEMKFKIGDCVRPVCADVFDSKHGVVRGIVVERMLQQCHGGTQEQYKMRWCQGGGLVSDQFNVQWYTPECLVLYNTDDDKLNKTISKALDWSRLSEEINEMIGRCKTPKSEDE